MTVAALMAASCAPSMRPPEPGRMSICRSGDFRRYPPGKADAIVSVGMSSPDVMKQRLCIRQQRVLVDPSGSMDGCEAEYGGVNYMLAFDKAGRLCHISSRSRTLLLEGGTGPGSTLAGIRGAYGGYRVLLMRGYGRMVLVRGGDVFGFEWDGSETIRDDERASWVELTSIPKRQ